jgi:hypothetical protein
MTSFFLYGNFPGVGTEILIASNHAVVTTAPLLDQVPDSGPGRTVRAYLDAYATGDTATMRRFFADHGEAGPDTPPIDVRLERFQQMRANLGRLTVRGARQSPDSEGLQVVAESERGTPLTMTFVIAPEPPYRLRGIRVEVGGS